MINIQTIENVGDCKPLYLPHSLYLKPLAKIHITVSLPPIKSGKSISNLEVMDKLSAQLKPDKFLVLKVSKSTVNFIRFEAEIDERKHLRVVIKRLDGSGLRLSNFNETFRVRCIEAKDDFPTRHDWDSYFRDASNMDEMKAGERPDTIHLTHLPIRWFCPRHSEHEEHVKPSESIFKRIFEKFGRVTSVDIPICDPYRKNMSADISGMRTFSFEQDVLFEAYVQFEEYQSFVRAMDEFRGTKLVRKFLDKNQAINICVTFDKEKHMSDINALRRERTRKRLIAKARAEDEEFKRKMKQEAEQLELERKKEEQTKSDELEKQRQREEKRKEKHLKKMQERGQVEISQKIRTEERKLLIAQRKLESIRILEQVFKRIQVKQAITQAAESHRIDDSKDLERGRLVEKYKTATEKLVCDQRKIVEDIKKKTPLMGLLKTKLQKIPLECSSDDEATVFVNNMHKNSNGENSLYPVLGPAPCNDQMLNPFKAVAAIAGNNVPASSAAYSAEAASEWMKSLSIFGYGVPGIFPGALYRPHPPFATSSSYRGFSRSRGRARMRGRVGRGGFDGYSSSYYNPKHYGNRNDEIEDKDSYYHRNHSKNRTRSSSYSRSRSRSRGRRRSHSRSRSRSYYRKSSYSSRSRRSRSQCRSRSRSYSKSSTHHINNRKLASTRRSRSSSYSQSRSRSQSYTYSRRSKSRCKHATHSRSRSNSKSSNRVVLETDDLVRSAEQIQRAVAMHTKDRMREEERKIIKNFSSHQKRVSKYDSHVGAIPQSQENDLKMKDLTAENNLKEDHNSNRNIRHQSLPS